MSPAPWVLPGKGKLTLQVLGNHILPFPVVLHVGQTAELLGLCFLWHNTELSFPSHLPGCFAGGSNLLRQGGRGMGAAHGKGRSPMTDHIKQKKKILQPFCLFFFPSSLRKNPAERMNYLELMVSAELLLLVFIPSFETQVSGPAGKWDSTWVIFQAWSGMGVVSEVEGCVDFMGVKVRVSSCFLPLSYLLLESLDLEGWQYSCQGGVSCWG